MFGSYRPIRWALVATTQSVVRFRATSRVSSRVRALTFGLPLVLWPKGLHVILRASEHRVCDGVTGDYDPGRGTRARVFFKTSSSDFLNGGTSHPL